MRNQGLPERRTVLARSALGLAAIAWLAIAGCDGAPVAERANGKLAREEGVAAGPIGASGTESVLPTDPPSGASDGPVGSAMTPAANGEPAFAASGLEQPAEDRQPAEPAREPTVNAGGSEATAEPAAIKPPTRPPADRTPRRPGEAERISFDDLNLGMAADMVYRPFLLNDRVQELDGQKVSIMGYIHGGATGKVKEFILLKNTECKFGPGGQADHLARIYLAPGQTTTYRGDAIKVEGKLVVNAVQGSDGNTWSVYDLVDAKVVR